MRRWRVVLLAMLLVSLWGCRSDQERFRRHHERAEEYGAEGRWAEALIELRNALALNPLDAQTNFEIARGLQEQGRIGQAVFYYSEARRLDPEQIEAYLAEARLLLEVDPDRAGDLIRRVQQKKLRHVAAHVLLAKLRLFRGDLEGALAAVRQAVEYGPENAEAHHVMGEVELARGLRSEQLGLALDVSFLESALAAFERAAALGDAESRWRSLLGRAGVLSVWPDRATEAAAAFRATVEAARASATAEHPILAVSAAQSYAFSIGDDELRRQFLEVAVEVDEADMGSWVALARLEQESERPPDAVFARLLERRPDDPRAHVTWADWLADHGRRPEGIAHLERALERGLDASLLLEALSALQIDAGEREAFARTAERMQREHPDSASTRRVRARRAILELSPVEAAVAVRELAGRQEDAEVQRLLALAEFRLGNLEAATLAIDRALVLGPISPVRTLAQRVRIRHAAADWQSTLRTLAQLRFFRPLDPEEELILARCFYGLEREAEGQKVLLRLASQPKPFVPAVLELARREMAEDPEAARARLEAAYERLPDSLGLLRRLSAVDVALGAEERALARLDGAVSAAPDRAPVRVERARLLGRLGRLEAAEADVRRALELAPGDRSGLAIQVEIHRRRGQIGAAIDVLEAQERAGSLGPPDRVVLARLLQADGREAQARAQYEQALASGMALPRAKADLALLLARSDEDLERARVLAQEAFEALPGEPMVLDTLGYVLLRKGLADAAEEQFRAAIRLAEAQQAERPEYHYHLGLALRMAGMNRSAVEAFEQALAIDPDFPDAEKARDERDQAYARKPFQLGRP